MSAKWQVLIKCYSSGVTQGIHFTHVLRVLFQVLVWHHSSAWSLIRSLTSRGNPFVEVRRSYDCLISSIGFLVLERLHLYIESGPWLLSKPMQSCPGQDFTEQYLFSTSIKLNSCFEDFVQVLTINAIIILVLGDLRWNCFNSCRPSDSIWCLRIDSSLFDSVEITNKVALTHCGLVTPYGDIDLDQHWLR